MSFFIRSFYVFFSSFLLFIYFSKNIKEYDQGSLFVTLLGTIILFSLIILLIEIIFYYDVEIKRSFFFLIVFWIYVIIKIIIDSKELYTLKVFTVSTTGGIILFYTLGAIVSLFFMFITDQRKDIKNYLKTLNNFYLIFFVIFFIVFFDIYLYFIIPLKNNLFLLANQGIEYQRAGTFLVISFMILTFLFNYFIIVNSKNNKLIINLLVSFIYFLSILGAILLSQIMGSNNAFVNLSFMLLLTLTFMISICFFKVNEQFTNEKSSVKNILSFRLSINFILSGIIAIGCILFIFLCILFWLDIDISQLRIFGFGSGNLSSIISRIELWNNFFIHFSYNPIFGNVNIDKITTGEGTYVHSFIGSLLTHFGLIGFCLFFIYLYFVLKETLNLDAYFPIEKLILIFKILFFMGIFMIATLSVFMNWIPLWFLFGLIFPPILLRKKKYD